MSLQYILQQAGNKMGMNPADTSSRLVLLRFVNEAVAELYDQSDMPGSLIEQVFKVNGDQTISCPSYVGNVRAVREFNSQNPWHLNQMRPRYNQFNWSDAWRNYRLKGKQALMTSVTNQSVGVLTVAAVETPNITVTVTGPTSDAESVNEDVVMNSLSVNTVNQFTDYISVKKSRVNGYNISLSDVDGKVLTVIPNNQLSALYQVIDVSTCPWLGQNTSVQDNYVEILYKKALPSLVNDGDEFLTGEYDNIIVNKVMQLWNEEQNKGDIAVAYDGKATRSLARKHEEQNRGTEDMVSLVANPHDTMLPRVNKSRRRPYRYYGGRRD